jgi:hypothetical protein
MSDLEFSDDFRAACQREFTELHRKLDRLDDAIRGTPGNGTPGIRIRLDRLEQNAGRQSKLIWLIVGALATGGGSALTAWLLN